MFLKIVFIIVLIQILVSVKSAQDCITPNGQTGDCKPINQCQSLYSIFKNRAISSSTADFVRQSLCGYDGVWPKVCCASGALNQLPLTATSTKSLNTSSVKSNLLLEIDSCGLGTQSRIFGGKIADLDELPWLALLEYKKDDGTRDFYCGGVLISKRYVLTAAHCVTGRAVPKKWKLVSVRLGEHNTKSDPDCVNLGFGIDCAPSHLNIPIQETIVHQGYDARDKSFFDDIALLRLVEDVKFNDFVKPICLPTTPKQVQKTYGGRKALVAGWGRTENSTSSDIKLKVQVPVVPLSQCNETYTTLANINVKEKQICAGGEKGKDSCSGDSGGPLMVLTFDENRESRWYAIGVVSYGLRYCGTQGVPGVYTRVAKYMEWILDNIKP